jgi:predicted ribosomally synthesized peptide with nif11-like leader
MSEEQLKAFLEAVKADAGLQEQLKAAGDADAVVAVAKAAGFVISADDLNDRQIKTRSLDEAELEGVSGGFPPTEKRGCTCNQYEASMFCTGNPTRDEVRWRDQP